MIRILIAETQAKNPALLRAAQENLEDLARTEPGDATVQLALGRLYREAGLSARAREAFGRALTLDPFNGEATTALGALSTSNLQRPRRQP